MIEKLDQPNVQAFIRAHQHDDPAALMLNARQFPDLPMREIANQIASRQRALKKIPQWCAHERVILPPRQNLEQASSEQTAQFKARFLKGKQLLDLTAGTGIDAFYLSEHFEHTVLVEPNTELCALLEHNFSVLGKKISIQNQSAEDFLAHSDGEYDVIYLDPSRRSSNKERVFGIEQYQPNVVELYNLLMEYGQEVVIKTSPMLDISHTLKLLPDTFQVITLAVENELKEILFFLNRKKEPVKWIEAVNLTKKGEDVFKCGLELEQQALVEYAAPGRFIYEPNVAIRKAGGFNGIADAFGLKKLSRFTHLYTSDELKPDFPGKVFRFVEFIKPGKKTFKKRFPLQQVHIVSKNYPLGANALKKKYHLKDGGTEYLFFCEVFEMGNTVFIGELVG